MKSERMQRIASDGGRIAAGNRPKWYDIKGERMQRIASHAGRIAVRQ